MSGIEERIAEALRKNRLKLCTSCCLDEDAYDAHVAAVLVADLGLTEHTTNAAVFVEDVPQRMVWRGLEEVPAMHVEFIPHARLATPWHSPDCPDCAAEPGVHDRRRAEILAQTQEPAQ